MSWGQGAMPTQRPGVLTVVGVVSIALGAIGLGMLCIEVFIAGVMGLAAMGGGGAGPGNGWQSMGGPSRIVAPPAGGLTSTSIPTAPAVVATIQVSPDGIDAATSDSVAGAMQRGHLLTEAQRKQLIALLEKVGKQIFPGGPVAEQPAAVHEKVYESRAIPGFGAQGSSMKFVLRTGEVDVYDDHAEFRPRGTDGKIGTDVISATAVDSHGEMNAKPQAAVLMATTLPGARMVPVQVRHVTVASRLAINVMLLDYLVSAALWALLVVAGILLLANSSKAIALHWTYVAVKIPLVVLAAAGNWYVLRGYGLMSSDARVVLAHPWLPMMGGIVVALIGLAYPVVLIAVLRSPAGRRYAARVC